MLDWIRRYRHIRSFLDWFVAEGSSEYPGKKRAGRKPRSANCVDPISPKNGFDFDLRVGAACARLGSSRDLDHQAGLSSQPELTLVDHLFRLVTIFSNDCSKFEQFT
jgi:hypothetical protein